MLKKTIFIVLIIMVLFCFSCATTLDMVTLPQQTKNLIMVWVPTEFGNQLKIRFSSKRTKKPLFWSLKKNSKQLISLTNDYTITPHIQTKVGFTGTGVFLFRRLGKRYLLIEKSFLRKLFNQYKKRICYVWVNQYPIVSVLRYPKQDITPYPVLVSITK